MEHYCEAIVSLQLVMETDVDGRCDRPASVKRYGHWFCEQHADEQAAYEEPPNPRCMGCGWHIAYCTCKDAGYPILEAVWRHANENSFPTFGINGMSQAASLTCPIHPHTVLRCPACNGVEGGKSKSDKKRVAARKNGLKHKPKSVKEASEKLMRVADKISRQ